MIPWRGGGRSAGLTPVTISITVDYAAVAEVNLPNPTLVSAITAITKANPGQVTAVAHGFTTGRLVNIFAVAGMTEVNGQQFTVTRIDADHYTLGVDTSAYTTYTSGGICFRVPQVDGVEIFDGASVLFPVQLHDLVEDGVYVYEQATNSYSRHPQMPDGDTITAPYYIAVSDAPVTSDGSDADPGDDNAGLIFGLEEASFVVGTDENNWAAVDSGGIYAPNYILAGPGIASARPNTARVRPMQPTDLPQLGVTGPDGGYFKQSMPQLMIKAPRLSSYVRFREPWDDVEAFQYLLNHYREFVVDQPIQFGSAPTLQSSRRIIFDGTGWSGPVKILTTKANLKPFDVSGITDLWLDGWMVFEPVIPNSGTVPAIGATSTFTNLRLGKVWSRGFSHAVRFATAHGGFNIEEVNVYDTATEVGFSSTNPSGSASSTLRRNLAVPTFQTIATDADATIKAHSNSDIIEHTGVLTADRTLTLSTENVTRDKQLVIQRDGVDEFSLAVGSIAVVRTGDKATIAWDAVAAAWKLVHKEPRYSSGTFTPVVTFATPGNSSFTYGTQVGYYQRHGNTVTVDVSMIVTPTIGTGSGNIQIGPLPFTVSSAFGGSVFNSDTDITWPAGVTQLSLTASGTIVNIRGMGSAQNTLTLTAANMTSGNAHTITFTLRYRV